MILENQTNAQDLFERLEIFAELGDLLINDSPEIIRSLHNQGFITYILLQNSQNHYIWTPKGN